MNHSTETKNKTLLVSMTVLLGVAAVLYFVRENRETIALDKTVFRVADLKVVDRIVLESSNDTVELKFNGTRWKVNDRHDADRNMIQVLFATLQQAEPRRLVASSVRDSVKVLLREKGVSVTLFSGDHPQKQFVAGGNDVKTQSWFYDAETDMAYLMHIPGYRVYVTGILELSENGWRDLHAFGFNWQNFKALEVRFTGKQADDFTVIQKGDFFGISEQVKTDTAKLNTFLDNVSLLTVNEYLDSGPLTDSLMLAKPFMTLTISDIGNRRYELKLFSERQGLVAGLLDGHQGVIFHRLKIQPILRPKSFFAVQ